MLQELQHTSLKEGARGGLNNCMCVIIDGWLLENNLYQTICINAPAFATWLHATQSKMPASMMLVKIWPCIASIAIPLRELLPRILSPSNSWIDFGTICCEVSNADSRKGGSKRDGTIIYKGRQQKVEVVGLQALCGAWIKSKLLPKFGPGHPEYHRWLPRSN